MPHPLTRHVWKAWVLVLLAVLVLLTIKAWP